MEMLKLWICIMLCKVGVFAVEVFDISNGNAVYSPTNQSGLKIMSNCSLVPEYPDQRDHIAVLANDEIKLIKITIKISGENGQLYNTYSKSVYNPKLWIISTSLTGKSLLMLKDYFDAMSLMTLGHGVAKMTLSLNQIPENCLEDADVEEFENTMRLNFLNNFDNVDKKLPEGTEICNAHVMDASGKYGSVSYVCCQQTLTGKLVCKKLKESIWLKILFNSILALQVIIILYSPMLLPGTAYKAKTIFEKFIFETEPGESLIFNVLKVNQRPHDGSGFVKTKQQPFTEFECLKGQLSDMEIGKVYTLFTNKIYLRVRMSKLVALGNAPVSTLGFIRNFFVRCKIRDDVTKIGECCYANMLLSSKREYSWYKCLQYIMMAFMTAVIATPWLLRVWFYYSVESEPILHMKKVLSDINLTAPYTGNLVSYLTPVHPLFLFIYIVVLIEIVFYSFIITDSDKRKIKFTVRKCLREMRSSGGTDAFGTVISYYLWPLRRYGLVGCLFFPFWSIIIPFCFVLLSLEMFPIVNLSVRLLVNFVYRVVKIFKPEFVNEGHKNGKLKKWLWKRIITENQNRQDESRRSKQLIYAVALIMTFVTIVLSLIIIFECISFYVECAVYTLIGFILNPGDTMKYVSLLLLIAVYGNECFSSVHSTYSEFSSAINSEVQGMVGESMEKEAAKPDHEQENAAFRIPAQEKLPESIQFVPGSEKYLKVNMPRLALFLEKTDVPFIPRSFLFRMAKLPHHLCPGEIHLLYFKAVRDFSLILVFLFFVFVVIFAFGQAQDISSGGQAIAALGSGFLPLVLRKFLFQSHGGSGFDKSNLKWKNMFAQKVQNYVERWNFEDIVLTQPPVLADSNAENIIVKSKDKDCSDVDLIVHIDPYHQKYSYFVPELRKKQVISLESINSTRETDL